MKRAILCLFLNFYLTGFAKEKPTLAFIASEKAAWVELFFQKSSSALQNEFTILDRTHIAKLLEEQKLSVSQIVSNPVRQAKLLGCKYFIYCQTELNGEASKVQWLLIEATTGNVLGEGLFVLDEVSDEELERQSQKCSQLTAKAIAQAEKEGGMFSAAVLSVNNKSRSTRCDFLEDTLASLFENVMLKKGCRIFKRQHTTLLAKETELSIMGLVRPDSEVIAAAADLAVKIDYVEQSSEAEFKDTPIKLSISFQLKGGQVIKKDLTTTINQLGLLPKKLFQIIPKESDKSDLIIDEKENAKLEAARIMADLKPLAYVESKREHLKTIELAKKVIYLDPSCKDAYFILARSLDPLIRSEGRWIDKKKEMKEIIEAFTKYLQFPRTNKKYASEAFDWVCRTYMPVYKLKDWEATISITREYARWYHSVASDKELEGRRLNIIQPAGYRVEDWWRAKPEKRLEWYDWYDQLYDKKKVKSVCAKYRVYAYDQLGRHKEAAESLYDLIFNHRDQPSSLRSFYYQQQLEPQIRKLTAKLDKERSQKLLKACKIVDVKPEKPHIVMYGDALGKVKDIYRYSYDVDEILINKAGFEKVKAEELLPKHLNPLISVFIRQLPSGLYVSAMDDKEKVHLLHMDDKQKWTRLDLPKGFENYQTSINDMCEHQGKVYLAIAPIGIMSSMKMKVKNCLLEYDLKGKAWRVYTEADGLGSSIIHGLQSEAGKLHIYGAGFLTTMENGKFFLSKTKYPNWIKDVVKTSEAEVIVEGEGGPTIFKNGKKSKLSSGKIMKKMPLPSVVTDYSLKRSYNAGIYSHNRALKTDEKIFITNEIGLLQLKSDGQLEKIIYPTSFYEWNDLVIWLQGNSTLPTCSIKEVIPDDENPDHLWIISKLDTSQPNYFFSMLRYLKVFRSSDERAFITLYNHKTGKFSKPSEIEKGFVHTAASGKKLYMTGDSFRSIPKSHWKLTESFHDTPVFKSAETLVGRASLAFFSKNYDEAKKLLKEAQEKGILPSKMKALIKKLERLK